MSDPKNPQLRMELIARRATALPKDVQEKIIASVRELGPQMNEMIDMDQPAGKELAFELLLTFHEMQLNLAEYIFREAANRRQKEEADVPRIILQ